MILRTRLLLVALAVALGAGCSGSSDKPKTLPSIATTVAATASAAPVPAAAKVKTPQGAEAFVRYFFQQLNTAFSTADAGLIRAYSDPICKTCANYIESIQSEPNLVTRGDSFALTDVAVPPIDATVTNVDVFGTGPARERVKADGTVVRRIKASGRFHFIVAIAREGENWKVASIGLGT